MPRTGRRPGDADTRQLIVDAARAEFAESGYNDATIRSIARRAEVDPALVYHYFGEKSALYVASANLPVDPRRVKIQASQAGGGGAQIVERFLAQWERDEVPGQAFVTLVQAVAGSPDAADSMREFLTERVWGPCPPDMDEEVWARRSALVSSQLVGVAWTRYILKVEPMASASRRRVAQWVGPIIDDYRHGRADGPAGGR